MLHNLYYGHKEQALCNPSEYLSRESLFLISKTMYSSNILFGCMACMSIILSIIFSYRSHLHKQFKRKVAESY